MEMVVLFVDHVREKISLFGEEMCMFPISGAFSLSRGK